jgi:hypothetical protein
MKNIPTLTELHPRISELEGKRYALQIEKNAKVAEAAIIRARIQESPSAGNAAENRVRAILGEPVSPDVPPDMLRLDALLRELNDMNKALGILDANIQKERVVASRLVLAAVKSDVATLGKAFAKAFLDLHTCHLGYNKFIDSLEDVGVSVSALRVCPNGLGFPTDLSGTYMYGVCEFIEAGYLEKSQMPKVLR